MHNMTRAVELKYTVGNVDVCSPAFALHPRGGAGDPTHRHTHHLPTQSIQSPQVRFKEVFKAGSMCIGQEVYNEVAAPLWMRQVGVQTNI